MSLSQANTAGILYVRSGGSNGDGSLFTPYTLLSDAQNALNTLNQSIDIMDCSTHIMTIANTSLLSSLHGLKATTSGNISLSKNNCFYHVANHESSIDIDGNDVIVVVDGEVKGDIICNGLRCKIFINFFDDTTYTIAGKDNIADGSKIGDRTFGFKAER